MAKKIAAHVAGDGYEGRIADPACHPPEQIVGCDQRHQQTESEPRARRGRRRLRQGVDQQLDPVLGHDGAQNGGGHARQNDGMSQAVGPDVAPKEGDRPVRIGGEIFHWRGLSPLTDVTRRSRASTRTRRIGNARRGRRFPGFPSCDTWIATRDCPTGGPRGHEFSQFRGVGPNLHPPRAWSQARRSAAEGSRRRQPPPVRRRPSPCRNGRQDSRLWLCSGRRLCQ